MAFFHVTQQQGSQPDTVILRPDGPLNINVLAEFNASTKAATAKHLVLDLSGIPHMDSAGLGALLTLHAALQKEDRTLALAHPEKRVQVLIALTKADTILKCYPSVEAAEHA
jgi:anti-sigma B factor antagonist